MLSALPAFRTSIGPSQLSARLLPTPRLALTSRAISTSYPLRQLQHLHPSEGAGQTLQPPNTSSTAADAVKAALGTSKPPVGASSNSKVLGIEELKLKAKKLYKEVSRLVHLSLKCDTIAADEPAASARPGLVSVPPHSQYPVLASC